MAEQTLGDILGAVLAEAQPLSPIEAAVVQAITEEAFREQAEQWDTEAMVLSAWELSRAVAPLINATAEEVYAVLGTVPSNMLELLKSPQGWSTLAGYVAGDLGRALPDYKPTIH